MRLEHQAILIECLKRQEAHRASQRPPAWQAWSCDEWDAVTDEGPRYSGPEWFPGSPEFQRQRYRRAVHELARDGYLECFGTGGRLYSIKLTAEGETAACQLLEAAP